ncbi:hypothetical protein K449DRAFT_421666 [Hypoxylon sp. EC38]|nr:hypothetical protein K449DRAFT_421666 [Hypoxylon sp. EC38]
MDEPWPNLRVWCRRHGRTTCEDCLHSIIRDEDGSIPDPINDARIPYPESGHSVEPRFELVTNASNKSLGFDGRRVIEEVYQYSCGNCQLVYWDDGGTSNRGAHPSHICSNGQRYIQAWVRPMKFSRESGKIECSAYFIFDHISKMNATYKCMSKSDYGTADWNLENSEIAALTQLLTYVEDKLIPYRKQLTNDYLFTNSEYFASQAWRFQLIVLTSLNPAALDLLLRAHKLKYSARRKAFVEKNALGIVTSKIPVTEERWYQMASFVRKVKNLAALGIPVYWHPMEPDKRYEAARAGFMNEPPTLPAPQSEVLEDYPDPEEEDLIEGDSFDNFPSHEGFEAVESDNPEESPELPSPLATFYRMFPHRR